MTDVFADLDPPYATIVADPPWRYRKSKPTGDEQHNRRWAEDVYSTMSMAEVAALPVESIAADNAHLYLWVTNPRLFGERGADGTLGPYQILSGWGFRYVTMLTWVKPMGLGSYFRGSTEHVLFGVRGTLGIDPSDREPNVIEAGRGSHSEKPAAFYDLVERVSPGPYVDLFCRQPRFGWDSWGYGYEVAS